jgi:hypothetical protein
MTWAMFHTIWPVLALLLYILVMCIVKVLSANLYHAMTLHNRICEARNLRRQYLEEIDG